MRGAIIAGGAATRFGGQPKGLVEVGGRRILDRLVAAMEQALGATPLLVANAADAATWRPGLAVVPDVRAGLGALGGIYSAVVAAPAPVVVVAWDMPFVTPNLLALVARGLAGHDVSIPASDGPRGLEPLCAAYGPRCREAIERAAQEDDLRAVGFHRFLDVHIVPGDEVARVADPALAFFNVNTPSDLEQAQALWQARASSRSSDERTRERPR